MNKKKSTAIVLAHQAEKKEVQAANPMGLIQLALANNADIEKLERLMAMQEKWEARKAKEAFNQAFTEFQSIAPDLVKNKQVSFDHREGTGKTEYRYQELGDIAKHIRAALAKTGLSYSWEQKEEGKVITVWCTISHVGGHEKKSEPLTGEYDTSGKKNNIQQKASTITYLRRYTLTGALGLSTMDPDNDGKGGAKGEENDLPKMTELQFKNSLAKVVAGEWTLELIKSKCTLTPEQEKAISIAEQSKKK